MSAVDKTVHLPITHLICDCDGVLVDSESVAYLALLEVLSERLGDSAPGPGAPGKRTCNDGMGDGDIAGDGARLVGRAALARAIQERLGLTIEVLLGQIAALAGAQLSAREIASMREDVEGAVRARQTPVPGIASALSAIGLPVAVASNSSLVRVREAVACSGVGAIVGDRLFTADVVGVPKPAPDVYLAACAGFGIGVGTESDPIRVDVGDTRAESIQRNVGEKDEAPLPAHCLAVEDSLAGVRAAVSAGMQVLGFAGGGHIAAGPGGAAHLKEHVRMLRNAGALGVFDDMRALPGIVAALQKRALLKQTEAEAAHFLDGTELIRLHDVLSETG
jgi:beta-phosphoglucomutase-like phosphatase (HAD superfamily)